MNIISLLILILVILIILFILSWFLIFYLYDVVKNNIFVVIYLLTFIIGIVVIFLFKVIINTKLLIFLLLSSGFFYLGYRFLFIDPFLYVDDTTKDTTREFFNMVVLIYLYLIIILFGIYAMSSND